MHKKSISFFEAIATLVGTIIGAGVLGLPYVISKVGWLPGSLLLIVLGVSAFCINLMFAEIVLRTRIRHQISGYARKYLGSLANKVAVVSILIGAYGALTAYLIGEGQVLSTLLGGSSLVYSLIFFVVGAFILFVGLNLIKVIELWMVGGFISIILIIFFISVFNLDISNLKYINLAELFTPYGVILFSFGGVASIVPMREVLKGQENKLKKAVIWASFIPFTLYLLFTFAVVGLTGLSTTEVATLGLGQRLGQSMIVFGNLFALLAMGSGFLSIGITLKETFNFDFHWKRVWAWLAVVMPPLFIFLAGGRSFIQVMGIVGSLTFGLTGIILVFTFWKAKQNGNREPEFSLPKMKIVGWFLILMFALGIIYTFRQIV